MFKEIVSFSDKLEKEGIYDLMLKSERKIDKPIIVIPFNSESLDINFSNYSFLYKELEKNEEDKFYGILDSSNNKDVKIEILKNSDFTLNIEDINHQTSLWSDIYLNIPNFTNKIFGSSKNIDRVGGINSYNILAFNVYRSNGDEKDDVKKKIEKTFFTNKSNLKLYLPSNLQKELLPYLEEIGRDINILEVGKIVDLFFETNQADVAVLFFKLPDHIIEKNNVYELLYKIYVGRKSFAKDNKKYQVRPKKSKSFCCNLCNKTIEENSFLSLPDSFNSLNDKKTFLLHHNRKMNLNGVCCSACSGLIYKFEYFFLNKLGISIFPLFVDIECQKYSVELLRISSSTDGFKKIGFKDIISSVYKKKDVDTLNFYLIICQYEGQGKDRNVDFLSFDYITGFKFYINGINIFQIEWLLNKHFFEDKLYKNYFKKKLDELGNIKLANLLYSYRTKIFDYVYRAKYNSLNSRDIKDIFLSSTKIKFQDYLNSKHEISNNKFLANILASISSFYKLDSFFGGDILNTVERIKSEKRITDLESLSFYIGQAVYFLLTKSEKTDKTHAMVEPFINLNNFSAIGLRLEELFNAYKHKLRLSSRNMNNKFSEIWAYIYDTKHEKFTKDLKILFYAGYFDTNSNIFFEKSEKNNNEKENNNE
jgi:CRISPR-associated protein Csh1